jgi:hypothetical protein
MLQRLERWAIPCLVLVLSGLLAGCGNNSSNTSTANNQTAAPAFSPGGGTYTSSQTVTISSATAGAVLYCTTDGTPPTSSSPLCSEPTTVYKTEYLQAIAIAPSMSASSVTSAGYVVNLNAAPTPTFSPNGGTYASPQQVTISDTLAGANIYYTLDGSVPTTSSTLYTGPVAISQSLTLNAIAAATGYTNSGVASALYVIEPTVPVPTIASLSPTSATAGGAAFTMTVSGTNFVAGASVLWNGTALTSTYVSATQLTAAVPPSLIASAGAANVTVVTSSGVSAVSSFTINAGTPTVTGVAPASGATGTTVLITGTNLGGATAVAFGATAATSFTVISPSSIMAVSPAGTGTVDIKIVTPGGTSAASAADQFVHTVLTPTITGITPASGSAAGGTSVTITGTNLTGATAVTFGGIAAASYIVNSANSITAFSPAGTGTVDIEVVTPGGTSTTSAADEFSYTVNAPAVSSLSPTSGAIGTPVTIAGTHFGTTQGSSTVSFNGVDATSITSWSDTQIVATVPSGASSGAVVVTVEGTASNSSVVFSVGQALNGTVRSGPGSSPFVSSVQLYAAGSSGYGQGPSRIGSAVQTDASGNFSVVYSCTTLTAPGDQLYLVATSTTSSSVVLMAPLGSCTGVSTLGSSVTVNEVTTVTAAYALSAFASIDTVNGGIDIGAPGTITSLATTCNAANHWQSSGPDTCNYLGIVNAFNTALNIINVEQGAVWAAPATATWHSSSIGMTPAYATASAVQYLNDSTIPTARIDALADMLATCVQNVGTGCSGLFSAAAAGGTTPTDTLQTALTIALNPGKNVSTLLGLVPSSNPPYATTLALSGSGAPTDLTLALTFTGAGLGIAPGTTLSDGNTEIVSAAMSIDSAGDIWVGGYRTNGTPDGEMLAEFNSIGAPLTAATTLSSATPPVPTYGGYDPEPSGSSGPIMSLTIDQSQNLWAFDGDNTVLEINPSPNHSITYTSTVGGPYIAIDASGNAWWDRNNAMQEVLAGGSAGITGTSLNATVGSLSYTAFDSNGGLWAAGFATNSGVADVYQLSTTDGSISYDAFPSSPNYANTSLVADGAGNIYGCDPTAAHLDVFNAAALVNSYPISTTRGCGTQLVLDGQGHLFAVASSSALPPSYQAVATIDEFTTGGTVLSPGTTGYTGTSAAEPPTLNPDSSFGLIPTGVGAAIDGSGNLWVINATTSGTDLGTFALLPGNVLIEYIGIGAPVLTPIPLALTNGLLGARP